MSTGSGTPRIADARAWRHLLVVVVLACVTIHARPWTGRVWAVVVALLFLRAGAWMLAARAAGADPEEKLHHDGDAPKERVD